MTDARSARAGNEHGATRPMTSVGRAVEKGETQGFMKIVVDAETSRSWALRFWALAATR